MNRLNALLAVALISSTTLVAGAAPAMEITQFDRMADDDQDQYVAELVVGAQKVLRESDRRDLSLQVNKLFTELQNPGDQLSLGIATFEMNLARARLADLKRIEANPSARRLEVEDAMIVTLRKNNIELPTSFLRVNSNFKPKFPLRSPKQSAPAAP